jgi:putative endonuclease
LPTRYAAGEKMKPADAQTNSNWIVYILRCRDNTLYTGITNNIEKRLSAHNKGTASKYTRARLPVALMAESRCMSQAEALRLEIKIKQLPRNRKLAALAASLIVS